MAIKTIVTAAALATLALALGAPAARAKGCIKGAVAGGAARSMAGHGRMGAAAGCAVGHHEADRKDGPSRQGGQQAKPPGE